MAITGRKRFRKIGTVEEKDGDQSTYSEGYRKKVRRSGHYREITEDTATSPFIPLEADLPKEWENMPPEAHVEDTMNWLNSALTPAPRPEQGIHRKQSSLETMGDLMTPLLETGGKKPAQQSKTQLKARKTKIGATKSGVTKSGVTKSGVTKRKAAEAKCLDDVIKEFTKRDKKTGVNRLLENIQGYLQSAAEKKKLADPGAPSDNDNPGFLATKDGLRYSVLKGYGKFFETGKSTIHSEYGRLLILEAETYRTEQTKKTFLAFPNGKLLRGKINGKPLTPYIVLSKDTGVDSEGNIVTPAIVTDPSLKCQTPPQPDRGKQTVTAESVIRNLITDSAGGKRAVGFSAQPNAPRGHGKQTATPQETVHTFIPGIGEGAQPAADFWAQPNTAQPTEMTAPAAAHIRTPQDPLPEERQEKDSQSGSLLDSKDFQNPKNYELPK